MLSCLFFLREPLLQEKWSHLSHILYMFFWVIISMWAQILQAHNLSLSIQLQPMNVRGQILCFSHYMYIWLGLTVPTAYMYVMILWAYDTINVFQAYEGNI